MHADLCTRRRFFILIASTVSALAVDAHSLHSVGLTIRPGGHPEPRPGIDGSNVLKGDRVPSRLAGLYDGVRRNPQVVDGIRCYCGCADLDGFYSLLTCYESSGMALHCDICQDEGELVVRLHEEGRTLSQIRAAIDRRFG